MKKFMMFLLSLTVILSGCVQQEQPEEPPAVDEENGKLPDDVVDNEKEDTDKQNDDIIDDHTGSDEDDEQSTIEYVRKIYEDKEWIVETERDESWDFSDDVWMNKYNNLIFENGNEFENWFNTIYSMNPSISKFYINIDSQEIKNINDFIANWYDENFNYKLETPFQEYRYYVSEEILSLIVKQGFFHSGVGHTCNYYIYNIDLRTGSLISNQEMLNRHGITLYDFILKQKQYYDNIGSLECKSEGEMSEEERNSCHASFKSLSEETIDSLIMFVNNDGMLQIMWSHSSLNNKKYLHTNYVYNYGLPR